MPPRAPRPDREKATFSLPRGDIELIDFVIYQRRRAGRKGAEVERSAVIHDALQATFGHLLTKTQEPEK